MKKTQKIVSTRMSVYVIKISRLKVHFQNYFANRSIKLENFTKPFTTFASVLYQIYNSRLQPEFVHPPSHTRAVNSEITVGILINILIIVGRF